MHLNAETSTRRKFLSLGLGVLPIISSIRPAAAAETIDPFAYRASDEDLIDLHRRLARTRWPEKETEEGWKQGPPLAKLKQLIGASAGAAVALMSYFAYSIVHDPLQHLLSSILPAQVSADTFTDADRLVRQTQIVEQAKQVEKALLVSATENREGQLSQGRRRMRELRGADAAKPGRK